jgi:CxxC motif-containing protein
MLKKELVCIVCPLGCGLIVEYDDEKVISVEGNTCPRGCKYAQEELFCPTRMVTTTVKIDGSLGYVPVKTKIPVAKGKVPAVMNQLADVTLRAPVWIGDVVVRDVAGSGVDVVVTRHVT